MVRDGMKEHARRMEQLPAKVRERGDSGVAGRLRGGRATGIEWLPPGDMTVSAHMGLTSRRLKAERPVFM